MRLHRFYIEQSLGDTIVVRDPEITHQWQHVLRFREGNQCILWNSDFGNVLYSIRTVSKKEFSLVKQESLPKPPPLRRCVLMLALIKRENLFLSVRMAVECGVTDVYLVTTTQSQSYEINEEKLHKILIEACEQSGRIEVPLVHPVCSLGEFVGLVPLEGMVLGSTKISDEGVYSEGEGLTEAHPLSGVCIGPEGGFTLEEEMLLETRGVKPVRFMDTIMRAETAVVAGLVYVHTRNTS